MGVFVYACGGGGDSNNGSDTNPNDPGTPSWERFDILKLEGGAPEYQQVAAKMDDQGLIHFFYFKRGEPYEVWPRYLVNHVVWDTNLSALVGEEETIEVMPPNPGSGDAGLSNSWLLDVELTTDAMPLVAYQGGRIPQPANSNVDPCNPTFQGDLMVNLYNGSGWDEYLGIYGDAIGKNPLFTDAYVGLSGTIAVDSQNAVHMAAQAYYEMCDEHGQDNPDLMYVKQTMDDLEGNYSVQWEELVDEYNVFTQGGADVVTQMGYGCKLVLDAQDNPIIVYVGTPDQDGEGENRTSLRMARKVGNQWQTEIIQLLEDWDAKKLSVAIAPDGTIGVAYYMETLLTETVHPDHLKFASLPPGVDSEWDFHIVDLSSHCGDFPSLAFDADSRPIIAYYDIHANSGSYRRRENLRFARLENNRWQTETVATAGDIGKSNTVWVDADNVVHISTYEYNDQQIVLFKEQSE